MLEAQEKEIDGIKFKYQPLMAEKAREMFDKLAGRFGPAIAAAVEKLEDAKGLDLEKDLSNSLGLLTGSAGGLLREVCANLDPKFHKELVHTLGEQTHIMGEKGFIPFAHEQREIMFGTKLLTEFKWLGFCLSVQYADFLEPLRNISLRAVVLRAQANASLSGSPPDSTGTSTGSQQAPGSAAG